MGSGQVSDDTMALALGGDADAQSAMLDRVFAIGNEHVLPDEVVLHWAEHWARLAASHDRPRDELRLVGVLMLKAGITHGYGLAEEGDAVAAEAFARLNQLADAGDEEAAVQLLKAADAMAQTVDARRALAMAGDFHLDGL